MKKQIERLAHEPVAFYLHKRGQFLEKLNETKRCGNVESQVERIEREVDRATKKCNKDLYMQLNKLTPSQQKLLDYSTSQNFDALKFLKDQQAQLRLQQQAS